MPTVILRDTLVSDVQNLLLKRIQRLRSRKFVLFRWLRLKWLMKKYNKATLLLYPAEYYSYDIGSQMHTISLSSDLKQEAKK